MKLSGYVDGAWRDRPSLPQVAEPEPPPPPRRRLPRGVHRSGGRRKYPPLAVGLVVGIRRCVEVLDRDATSNERGEFVCLYCGARTVDYVSNVRRRLGCRCGGAR